MSGAASRGIVESVLGESGDNGSYPNARAVARRLRSSARLVDSLFSDTDLQRFEAVVAYLDVCPDRQQAKRNVRSLRRSYIEQPAYCIFETGGNWAGEMDWLRAAGLLALLRIPGAHLNHRMFDQFGKLIRRYEASIAKRPGSDLTAKINAAIQQASARPEQVIKAVVDLLLQTSEPTITSGHRHALSEVFSLVTGYASPEAASKQSRREAKWHRKRLRRNLRARVRMRTDLPRTRRTARPRSRAEREAVGEGLSPHDVSETRTELLVTAPDEKDLDLAEIVALRAHRIRQTRPFSTISNDCLSLWESRELYSKLVSIIDREGVPQVKREAAGLLLLQLFSAQALMALATITWSARPGRSGTITRWGEFTTDVPDFESFSEFRSSGATLPVKGVCAFVIPIGVQEAVHRLSPFRVRRRVFGTDPVELYKAAVALLHSLRNMSQRVTADRIAGYLPAAVYELTGDLRDAQLIFGARFDLPSNGLHYYGPTNSSLAAAYSKCANLITGDTDCALPVSQDWIVGSGLSACTIEVSAQIERLSANVARLLGKGRRGRRSHAKWLRLLDAVSKKAAWMFASASGWRNTDCVGELCLNSFGPDFRMAVVADKVHARSAIPFRVVSLGAGMFQRQMRSLMALYQRVVDAQATTAGLSGVADALRAALDGTGPIFLAFAEDGTVEKASAYWLADFLPRGKRLPLNVTRHRLATQWKQCGGLPRDLYYQLGHDEFRDREFGSGTIQCPLAFIERSGPVVERFLECEGWSADVLDFKNYAEPDPRIDWGLLQSPRRLAGEQRRDPLSAAPVTERLTVAELEKIGECVTTYWASEGNILRRFADPATNESPSKKQIEGAMHSVFELADIDQRRATRSAIRERLSRLAALASSTSDGEAKTVVTLPSRFGAAQPVVVPAALQAHSLITHLRELKRADDLRNHENTGSDSALISVLVDILLWHPIRNADHLHALLAGLSTCQLVIGAAGQVRIELTLGGGEVLEDWLSPHLAARIGRYWQTVAAVDVDRQTVDGVVTKWLQKASVTINRKNWTQWLIELGQEAGAIEWPGYLWSDITKRRVRKGLSPERCKYWRHNGIPAQPTVDPAVDRRPRVARSWNPTVGGEYAHEFGKVLEVVQSVGELDGRKRAPAVRKLKELQTQFESAESPKASPIALCILARRLMARNANKVTGKRLATATIKGYLNIAVRCLRLMNAKLSGAMGLAEIYDALLVGGEEAPQTGPAKKKASGSASHFREKREALLRLHAVLVEQFGVEEIDPEDWPSAYGAEPVRPFAEVLSEAEYTATSGLIQSWGEEARRLGLNSPVNTRIFRAARMSLAFQYRLGLRPAEAAGVEGADIWLDQGSAVMLFVRWNKQRRIKTDAGVRPISLVGRLSDDEQALLDTIVRDQVDAGVWGSAGRPLLAWGADAANQIEVVGRALRLALALVVGPARAKQNIARHSFANRYFSVWVSGSAPIGQARTRADVDVWCLSREMGHAGCSVTQANYIHIDHLASGSVHGTIKVSKPEISAWLNVDLARRRRWALALVSKTDRADSLSDEPAVRDQVEAVVKKFFSTEPRVENASLSMPPLAHLKGVANTEISLVEVGELLKSLSRGVRWGEAAYPLGLLPSEDHALLTRASELAAELRELRIDQGVFRSPEGIPLHPKLLLQGSRRGGRQRPNFGRVLQILAGLASRSSMRLVALGRQLYGGRYDLHNLPISGNGTLRPTTTTHAAALVVAFWLASSTESGRELVPRLAAPKAIGARVREEVNLFAGGPANIDAVESSGPVEVSVVNRTTGLRESQLACLLLSTLALYCSMAPPEPSWRG